ncbi:MAG: ribosome maturation factor RimM [Candidatus Promineifilaceae bacterium]
MNSSLDPKNNLDRRGSEENSEPRFLVVGEVAKPHGVRGEVVVIPHTDLPERFTWLDEIYVGESNPVPVALEGIRFHKGRPLLKLAGYNNRDEAEALRGQLLLVPEDQAIPLEDGEYFLYELIGLLVETAAGENLGTLTEVIKTGANNVFVVRGAQQDDILIPDIPEVVLEIDFDNQRMVVDPLPGLLNA